MRLGLGFSFVAAAVTFAVASRVRIPVLPDEHLVGVQNVWASFPAPLAAGVGRVGTYLRGDSGRLPRPVRGKRRRRQRPQFGVLDAVQAFAAILVCLPAAAIAARAGKKARVVRTFLAFALFPLAVVSARSFGWLPLGSIVGELIGGARTHCDTLRQKRPASACTGEPVPRTDEQTALRMHDLEPILKPARVMR